MLHQVNENMWYRPNLATLLKQLYLNSWTKVMKGSCWANVKKRFNGSKRTISALSWCCFDPGETMLSGIDMKFHLKQKLKFKWSDTHFIFRPRPDSTSKCLLQWSQIWMQCRFGLRNLSKSLIGNSELTCCDIFIFKIHMVTLLDSLIWVEVHFVKETTKQVSWRLGHIWTFKINSQNC